MGCYRWRLWMFDNGKSADCTTQKCWDEKMFGKAKDRFRWGVSWFQCVSTPNELSKRNATPKYKKSVPLHNVLSHVWPSPNTNIAPENGSSQKGNDRLPTIHFQVLTVGFREGIFSGFFPRQCWVTHQDITVYCRVSTRAVGEISAMPEFTSVQFGFFLFWANYNDHFRWLVTPK